MDLGKLVQVLFPLILVLGAGIAAAHFSRPAPAEKNETGGSVPPVPRPAFSLRLAWILAAFVFSIFLCDRQAFASPLLWGSVLLGVPMVWGLAVKDYTASEPARDVGMAVGVSLFLLVAVVIKAFSSFRLM